MNNRCTETRISLTVEDLEQNQITLREKEVSFGARPFDFAAMYDECDTGGCNVLQNSHVKQKSPVESERLFFMSAIFASDR